MARMLDQRISLRRPSAGRDVFGQSAAVGSDPNAWPLIAEVWASYVPVSDGEKARSGQVRSVSQGWFTIHIGTGVLPSDVLVFDGDVWVIDGVKPQGRRFEEITAMRKGVAV